MKTIIKNEKELNTYIHSHGDYDLELTYLSQDRANGDCFAIFGCTYATEAFSVASGMNLIISDDDYSKEIEEQSNSENPELAGFQLK